MSPSREAVLTVFIATDAVSLLCTAPVEAARLRQLLVELGCFIKITELVNLIADEVKQVSLIVKLAVHRECLME